MSTLLIDKKYLSFISIRLRNFTRKANSNTVASFSHSCERMDSRKKRGYFLEYKGRLVMKCHNCGESISFSRFLNDFDSALSKEYKLECFKEGIYKTLEVDEEIRSTPKVEKTPTDGHFENLIPINTLPPSNPAIRALERRMIPKEQYSKLYLAPLFYDWAKKFDDTFSNFRNEHPRLIIPVYDTEKKLVGFSCRAFGKEQPKYIQIRIEQNSDFIYGADKVDTDKIFYVLEGQIDSMFIPNSVAVGNANYSAQFIIKNKHNAVIIPDNDFRRNKDVCHQLKKAIENGFGVCLFPDHWKKDINDSIKSGKSIEEIMKYIQTHTKRGLEALLEFTLEKRC